MKIDIQNILYIIAIIVWIVVGFIRKNKKKEGRPATSMPPVGESQQPDISEMLEEILGKKRPEPEMKPVPVPQKPAKQKIKEVPAESLETITGTDFSQRSIKIKEKKTEKKIHTSFQKVQKSPSPLRKDREGLAKTKPESKIPEEISHPEIKAFMEESEFDLRKAIIYSEILKSPYQ